MAKTTTELSEYNKKYYQANKDKWANKDKAIRSEHNRKYYNKVGKVVCACGCDVIKNYMSRHIKTKKHIKLEEAKATEGEEILWTPKC